MVNTTFPGYVACYYHTYKMDENTYKERNIHCHTILYVHRAAFKVLLCVVYACAQYLICMLCGGTKCPILNFFLL